VTVIAIYLFLSHTLYIKFSIAIYYFFSACAFFTLLCGFKQVQWVYKIHDYIVGHALMFILLILSGLQIAYLQTWLLYHNALSAGVVIDDILKYARKSKEQAIVEVNQMSDLRTQVAEQDRIIKSLLQNRGKVEMTETANFAATTGSKGYGSTGVTVSINENASKAAVAAATTSTVPFKSASPAAPSGTAIKVTAATLPVIPTHQQKSQASVALSPITPSSILTNKKTLDYDLGRPSTATNVAPKKNQPPVDDKKSNTTGDFIFQQPTAFPSR